MLYLLGEKYISSVQNLASSENAKVVPLPADIQETIRGVIGKVVRTGGQA